MMMMSGEVVLNGGGDLKKNNEEDMVQQQQVPYLDEDIITQILLKIPAESLFNTFRYVCKSWLKKISTHKDIHLNRLLPSKPPCLITQEIDMQYNLITCFFTLTKEGMIEEQFDDLNTIFKTGRLWIRACCNGLILATDFRNPTNVIHVVNPHTNHKLIIPHPGGSPINTMTINLVFIPSTGEYKVITEAGNGFIRILTFSASDCYGSYSSNDRLQWRRIEAPKHILHSSVVAINGILYWTTISGNIVSFDASVEKFYETTYCHNHKRVSRRGHWGLIEIGGLLSTWSIRLEEEEYGDVWRFRVRVVKDFHREEWIDKYNISIDTNLMKLMHHHHHHHHLHSPVLSFDNGEVIIFHYYKKNTVWALNVKLNQWWEVGNKNYMKEKFRQLYFYGFHVNNKPLPIESIFGIED